MKKLWTVLITLVILSLTLGTIACGGGATEPTGGDTSSSGSGGGGTSGGDSSGETCCWRDGGTVAPVMPPGQINDLGGIIVDAIDSPHMDSSYTRCPLKIDFINLEWKPILDERIRAMCAAAGAEPDPEAQAIQAQLLDIDYLFKGQIIVDEQTGYVDEKCEKDDQGQQSCSGGDILGSFTFKLQLVDHHRDVEVVVKQGQVSWSGSIFNGLNAIKELSRTFKPLPQIIHDYEGMPEKATLEPEKDPVPAGEKMTIHLKDIVDYQGNKPQPWQWVVVKAEKGQIEIGNNGRDAGEGAVAFEVGSGAIDFIYKAPDKCDKDTENKDTITVYNTCNNDPRTAGSFPREKVIATKSFDIDCTGWKLEAAYTVDGADEWGELTYSLKVTATLKPESKQTDYSVGQFYVSDDAHVELHHSAAHLGLIKGECSSGECSYQAGYDGNLPLHTWLWTIPPSATQGALRNFLFSYSSPEDSYALWPTLTPGMYYLSLDGFGYPLESLAKALAEESLALPTIAYTYSCQEWDPESTSSSCPPLIEHSGTAHVPACGGGKLEGGLGEGYLPLYVLYHMYTSDTPHAPAPLPGESSNKDLIYSGNESVLRGDLENSYYATGSFPQFAPIEEGTCFSTCALHPFKVKFHLTWTLTKLGE